MSLFVINYDKTFHDRILLAFSLAFDDTLRTRKKLPQNAWNVMKRLFRHKNSSDEKLYYIFPKKNRQ